MDTRDQVIDALAHLSLTGHVIGYTLKSNGFEIDLSVAPVSGSCQPPWRACLWRGCKTPREEDPHISQDLKT